MNFGFDAQRNLAAHLAVFLGCRVREFRGLPAGDGRPEQLLVWLDCEGLTALGVAWLFSCVPGVTIAASDKAVEVLNKHLQLGAPSNKQVLAYLPQLDRQPQRFPEVFVVAIDIFP